MSLVLDSSVTLPRLYRDERTSALPGVFRYANYRVHGRRRSGASEVANVLEMNVRRRRHDAAFRDAALADLVPVSIDPETSSQAWGATILPVVRHRLTTHAV